MSLVGMSPLGVTPGTQKPQVSCTFRAPVGFEPTTVVRTGQKNFRVELATKTITAGQSMLSTKD